MVTGSAPVEADKRRVDQLVDLHDTWMGVHVAAGMRPDLGSAWRRGSTACT